MAEKKKRVRPTLTQVRALEAEIAELKEKVSFYDKHQGEDLRKVVIDLQEKLESQIDGTSSLVKDSDLWREKYQKLVKENEEIADKERMLSSDYKKLEKEVSRLKNRGFWARVFNK